MKPFKLIFITLFFWLELLNADDIFKTQSDINDNNNNTLFETLLISANDELVEQFIKNRIRFLDINKILNKVLNNKKYINLIKKKPKKISEIVNLSKEVRLKTRQLCIE